jgi:hypothetical protein
MTSNEKDLSGKGRASRIIWLILSFVLLVLVLVFLINNFSRATAVADQATIRDVVTEFGEKLQLVSVLAPSADVKKSMDAQYAPYITPDLLSSWESDPSKAPGRTVSSPWPERIDIDTLVLNEDTSYTITGTVVEVTSVEANNGTVFDSYPVTINLKKQRNGGWLISSFSRGPTTSVTGE